MKIKISIVILWLIIPALAMSQGNESSGKMLNRSEKESAVQSISKLLSDNYIFPDVAKEMGKYIQAKLSNKDYDKLSDPMKFAEELTKDLQSISKDKHIGVMYNPEQIKKMKKSDNTDRSEEFKQQMEKENYGFRKVERLSGNIGYIDFRYFGSGENIRDKVASVMGFVEDCNALIFDMRYNGGGDPTGIQVISSYLFGEQPVHLNDLYFRPNDTTEQYWTLKDIKGKRMPDIPVYVLTSSYTFSGAEEFSYNLKNLKRATIIGEVTGGGAHPGGMNIVDDNFTMNVPIGRAINPVTKTNWEGTGVIPDIEISSSKALTKAHILALENLKEKSEDEKLKATYGWLIQSLEATLTDINLNTDLLRSYAGSYGERKVYYENGKLIYQRNGKQKFELTPMTEDTFMLKEVDYFRVKFIRDDSGKITELIGIYDDGKTDKSQRIEN